MPKQDFGIPERSASRSRAGCGWRVALLAAILLLFVVGALVGFLLLSRGPSYALPNVTIVQPSDGLQLSAGKTLAVIASASSPQKITKQELWVDARLVYVTTSRDPQGEERSLATLLWNPQVGDHTLLVRATDTRGSVGTSQIVRVSVDAATAEPTDKPTLIQIVEPGDTIPSIAQENGLTPDQLRQANPNLADPPPPGEWVSIPPSDNVTEGRNDDLPGGFVDDSGDPQLPPDVPSGNAQPPGPLDLMPGLLLAEPGKSPTAPDLNVAAGPNCTANLRWRDNSDNESGFYVYRLDNGAPNFTRIASFAGNGAQVNLDLTYTDHDVVGVHDYYVVAHNGAGESASRVVRVVIPLQGCPQLVGSARFLEVEITELTTPRAADEFWNEMYCYASLKGSRPFERVPINQNEYLHILSGSRWNVESYYAGSNKRTVTAPEGGQPLRVEVECWTLHEDGVGWAANLVGKFDNSHPPVDWDGRALTGHGTNRDQSFTLTYHIRPWSGPGGLQGLPIDPDIPAPFDLRRANDWADCSTHTPGDPSSQFACVLGNYSDNPPLVWEWTGTRQIDGFRVYMNRTAVGGTLVPIEDVPREGSGLIRIWAVPSQIPCGETWQYAVSAFDWSGESKKSQVMTLSGTDCELALVEIELLTLETGLLNDGTTCTVIPPWCRDDTTMEAYGEAVFFTSRAERLGSVRSFSALRIKKHNIKSHRTPHWADLPLCHSSTTPPYACTAATGTNQNKMAFLVGAGDRIEGGVILHDSDDIADDLWCMPQFTIEGRTLDDWVQDRTLTSDGSQGYGVCKVTIRVHGERVGTTRLLPSGGEAPGMTSKTANLQVTGIEMNRLGNARITIHNAGPSTLIQDVVTFSATGQLFKSGAPPGTPVARGQERALVTIPAFGQTTIDTGWFFSAGWDNQLTVTVHAENFTDPVQNDNSKCVRIDLQVSHRQAARECSIER